ncbi:MAG TPA: orotate phosphoribosyltransferase [Thermoplasmata archaeon]|nr:orotate phosphoribosyltransferase [Thermoplasmata archaeon]
MVVPPRSDAPADHPALVALLLDSGAVRFGDFTLASGQHSDVYVDIKRAWTDPLRLRTMGRALAERTDGCDRLAGMELGAVPLVVAVALETGLPFAVIRKSAKAHGTQQRFEGDLPRGARVLLIEDVTTTGGSVVESIDVIRGAGARVDRVLTMVDRGAGAAEKLRALGVRLDALVTLDELRGARA